MPILGALVIAVCLSCTDDEPAGPGIGVEPPESSTGAAALLAQVVCTAQVRSRGLSCRHPADPARSGVGPAAALGQYQIELTSTNVQYDTLTEIFSFDVTLQNLLAESIGTPDGTTATGSKVVYVEGPTATAYYEPGDTGAVSVDNPDGHGTFTVLNQPYHFYPGILAPAQVSDTLNWRLAVPREVKTFSFAVLVFSATPSESKVPAEPPDRIPAWVYADSNMTHNDSPHMAGTFPRDVLWVSFKPEATQEEKQAAIDYIGGEVIGGSLIGGIYAVRVQDDGTTDPLFAAMEKLEAMPQVWAAFLDVEIGGTFLRPSDAANGWSKDDWALDPDSARGANWGLDWHPCEWADPAHNAECRTYFFENAPVDASVYSVDIHGNATTALLATIPARTIYWLGIAESGDEFVTGGGQEISSSIVEWWNTDPTSPFRRTVGTGTQFLECGIRYYSLPGVNEALDVPTLDACVGSWGDGTITSSEPVTIQ